MNAGSFLFYHQLRLEFMPPLKFHLATVKWLLILWVALVRFHWLLKFHWFSIPQGHKSASSSTVVRNVEARYEERQKLTNCPETKIRKLTSLTATSKSADRLMERARTATAQLLKALKRDSEATDCSATM